MAGPVRTTCPYCGVGCGVVAERDATGTVHLRGDASHPANRGRLCSKGAALGETLDLAERLLYPEIDGLRTDWDTALNTVADGFRRVIRRHGADAVAFYVSGQLTSEAYYVANKLMKGFIGSANIDTNSRLCMSSAVAGHRRAFGADAVPGCYADVELADLVVLVGSNAAWCHPVLYQRIVEADRRGVRRRLVVIDPRRTETAEAAELHLPVKPGTDAVLFNGLLHWLAQRGAADAAFVARSTEGAQAALAAARASAGSVRTVAEQCGLSEDGVRAFYELFAAYERVVTVFSQGVNQSSSGTDKVNAIINCHLLSGRIGRPGMGPFSITGQPNAMGGREVGGLANQLAAHMELDCAEHRALVQGFWDSPRLPRREGLKAVDLFRAVHDGRVRALWIMATNPADSLPDADFARAALRRCELLVMSDCEQRTDTGAFAKVRLPALTWGERSGTVTNSERTISRQRAFLPAPGEAREDWWIVSQVARRMGFGHGFPYGSAQQIFVEHAALSGHGNGGRRAFDIAALATLDEPAYDGLQPTQWPVYLDGQGRACGTPRLFADGRFFTRDGRARLLPIRPRPPAHGRRGEYPLVLNTGRVRDQWHTMTRSGRSARLAGHAEEPYAELHPADAQRLGIEPGTVVEVESAWGRARVRARVSPGQQPGCVFVPIHWTGQNSAAGRIGAVVNAARDPVSGQPEYKHTPVRVRAWAAAWYGFILSREALDLAGLAYWCRVRERGLWRYEIAGRAPGTLGRAVMAQLLGFDSGRDEWTEYSDLAAGRYRAARLRDGRLEACGFVAPAPSIAGHRGVLRGLFGQDALSPPERMAVLAGRAGGRAAEGPQVCACFGVGRETLVSAIRARHLTSVAAVGAALKAGTNCGSCVPELQRILAACAPRAATA